MNKYIRKKRKEVIASERYIKFIIKHQNKLHRRYYSNNVPKKYKVVNVLRARKLMYKNVYEGWKYMKMNDIYYGDCIDGMKRIANGYVDMNLCDLQWTIYKLLILWNAYKYQIGVYYERAQNYTVIHNRKNDFANDC